MAEGAHGILGTSHERKGLAGEQGCASCHNLALTLTLGQVSFEQLVESDNAPVLARIRYLWKDQAVRVSFWHGTV